MKYSCRKFFVLSFFILVTLQLAGCRTAPGARFTALAPIDAEKGDVYLYRTKAFFATGQSFDVKLQDLSAGQLYDESYLRFRLDPGTYKLTVSPGPLGVRSHLNIDVKAGERRYYQFDFVTGLFANYYFIGSSIEPRTAAVAEEELKTLIAAQTDSGEKASLYPPTKFAKLEDVDAIPFLTPRGKEAYKVWLTKSPPRAFIIAENGTWEATWGNATMDRTEPVDAVARGMQRCSNQKNVGCRVYAVDKRVVWVTGPELKKEVPKFVGAKPEVLTAAPAQVASQAVADRAAQDAKDAKDAKELASLTSLELPGRAITPIFSQLLYVGDPAGFTKVSEKALPLRYVREAVPAGENAGNWSQMMTVTGVKDTAADTAISPENYADHIASGFKDACPDSYGKRKLSEGIVNGYEQYVFIVSCGSMPATAGRKSETALVIVIKGERDYYSVQWSERGEPSATPIPINMKKWLDRYKQLAPVKLCARVDGEQAPYPSCTNAP